MCEVKIYKSMPYTRGQVWLVDEPYQVTQAKLQTGTSVFCKTRPYLIYLSNASSQLEFNIIQGFPISSNDKLGMEGRTFYDYDIRFRNQKGEINRIITGQLTSIDTRYVQRYLFSLPEELMQSIDQLMMERFGMGDTIAKLKSYVRCLEYQLDHLKGGYMTDQPRQQLFPSQNNGWRPPRSGTRPSPQPAQLTTDDIPSANPEKESGQQDQSKTPVQNDPKQAPPPKPEKPMDMNVHRSKSGRIQWNTKTMKMFMDDYSKFSPEQIAEKYGLTLSQVPARKNYIQAKMAGKPVSGKKGKK